MGAFKSRVIVAVDEWVVRGGKFAALDVEALNVAFPPEPTIIDWTPSPAVAVSIDDYLLYFEEVQNGLQYIAE